MKDFKKKERVEKIVPLLKLMAKFTQEKLNLTSSEDQDNVTAI